MPQNKDYGNVDASEAFVGGPNATAVGETFVNALVEGKPLADDGSLYSTVQGAITAASGWVFVPPGTYNEAVTISTANLTLVGAGYDTLIDGGTTGNAITLDASNITVRDLSVQTTAGGGNSYDGILGKGAYKEQTLRNIWVRESDNNGLNIASGPNNLLVNVHVRNTDLNGIRVSGNKSIVIGCRSNNTNDNGIRITGADDCIVAYCDVRQTNNSNADLMYFQSNDGISLGNILQNSQDDGIYISDATDPIIANNRISDVPDVYIQTNNSSSYTLDGNEVDPSN